MPKSALKSTSPKNREHIVGANGHHSGWVVGSRYRLIRDAELTQSHETPFKVDGPKLQKGSLVLLLDLKQDSKFSERKGKRIDTGPLMGLVAFSGKDNIWQTGWCALDGDDSRSHFGYTGLGKAANQTREQRSWDVGGRYRVTGRAARRGLVAMLCCVGSAQPDEPGRRSSRSGSRSGISSASQTLRAGAVQLQEECDVDSDAKSELANSEEVVMLEMGTSLIWSGTAAARQPVLRAKVRTDSGIIGWLTVERSGQMFLEAINLYSAEAFWSGALNTYSNQQRQCVTFPATKGVTEGSNQAWKDGMFRVLVDAPLHEGAAARSRRRGNLRRGSLAFVEELEPHQDAGTKRLWVRVRVEDDDHTKQVDGWIVWTMGKRPPLDIRDHLEHRKLSEQDEGAPERRPSGRVPQLDLASVVIDDGAKDEEELKPDEYLVNLESGPDVKLGIHVRMPEESEQKELLIDGIGDEGLIPEWNARYPDQEVVAGDRITKVNGARGASLPLWEKLFQAPQLTLRLRRRTGSARSSMASSAASDVSDVEEWPLAPASARSAERSNPSYQMSPAAGSAASKSDLGGSTPGSLPNFDGAGGAMDLVLSESTAFDSTHSHDVAPVSPETARTVGWNLSESPRSAGLSSPEPPRAEHAPNSSAGGRSEPTDAVMRPRTPKSARQPAPPLPLARATSPLPLRTAPAVTQVEQYPGGSTTPVACKALEEVSRQAGYAWETEDSESPSSTPEYRVPPMVVKNPSGVNADFNQSRYCYWFMRRQGGQAPAAPPSGSAEEPARPTLLGLAALFHCGDDRIHKMRVARPLWAPQ